MAWVADGDLKAVSNAGSLGIIGGGNAPKEAVKGNIDRVKPLLTNLLESMSCSFLLLQMISLDLVIEEG